MVFWVVARASLCSWQGVFRVVWEVTSALLFGVARVFCLVARALLGGFYGVLVGC